MMAMSRMHAQPAMWRRSCTAALVLLLASSAHAAQVLVHVRGDGAMLGDAVVSLHPDVPPALPPATAEIDQVDATFVPAVLAVTVGTKVSFPNSDNTLHQVYSFSPTRRFELPLYSGRTAEPVLFDKPGVVAIGCNIHDWMVAHIVVLDTPYFARTAADGTARIDAPAGRYRLEVWHARGDPQPEAQAVELSGSAALERNIDIHLAPPPPERPGNERLRALQEKFRSLGRGS